MKPLFITAFAASCFFASFVVHDRVGAAIVVHSAFQLAGIAWLLSDEADWWAYVDLPQGRLPKFKFTWPEQLVFCAIVGSLIAAPATLAVWGIETLCRAVQIVAAKRSDHAQFLDAMST